jgi:hypothetical protein
MRSPHNTTNDQTSLALKRADFRPPHGEARTLLSPLPLNASMGASQSKENNEQVFYNPVPIQVSDKFSFL